MQIAIGTYDHTKALKDGSVSLPGVSFDFVEVSPITRAFRDMATRQAYDISEMALATYMLARIYDKPILGLPIVLVRSNLLPGLVTAADSPITDPRDLNGKTLGIRSYTQTSGVWVRGILQDGFGLDLSSLSSNSSRRRQGSLIVVLSHIRRSCDCALSTLRCRCFLIPVKLIGLSVLNHSIAWVSVI